MNKVLAGAALAVALASTAQAAPVTVAGVTWNPTASLSFNGATDAVNQLISLPSGDVSGTGLITKINGADNFCSACTLTFEFGGFTPVSGSLPGPTTTGTSNLGYAAGWVNVYVNPTVGPQVLWLGMVGHTVAALGGTTLNGSIDTLFGAVYAMKGTGFLDVVSGAAMSYFNTDAMADGADFMFSTTFTDVDDFTNTLGAGTFTSKSAAQVPEPTSIALIGLGLAGLVARRRKQAK